MTTRCPSQWRPMQFSGRRRFYKSGHMHQCLLDEGHTGPHAYERAEPVEAMSAQSSVEEHRLQKTLAELEWKTWGAKGQPR